MRVGGGMVQTSSAINQNTTLMQKLPHSYIVLLNPRMNRPMHFGTKKVSLSLALYLHVVGMLGAARMLSHELIVCVTRYLRYVTITT